MMRKTSVIPVGMTLVGDVEGDADLVVFGRVEGPIHVGGSLVIEVGAVVRGHVRGRSVTVRGVLKGDAFGDELVRVDESARLVGELTAPRVQVIPGAHFRGQIHVGQVGEPRLSSYDPRLHTFSGWPAPDTSPTSPGTLSGALSAGAVSRGTTSPGTSSAPPPVFTPVELAVATGRAVEPAPSASFGAPASVERGAVEPRLVEARVVEPSPTEPSPALVSSAVEAPTEDDEAFDEDATLSEATTFPPPPERLPLRMPRLGRTPGSRRWS